MRILDIFKPNIEKDRNKKKKRIEKLKNKNKVKNLIVEFLLDTDRSIRKEAICALQEIDPDWPNSEAAKNAARGFAFDLSGYNIVDDHKAEIRCAITRALAIIKNSDPLVVRALKGALNHDIYPNVRKCAAEALMEINTPIAVETLKEAVKHYWQKETCEITVKALLDKNYSNAADILTSALTKSRYWGTYPGEANIIELATNALVKIGEPAVQSLMVALNDSNGNLRENAVKALGDIGSPRALEPLIVISLTGRGEPLKNCAVNALEDIDPNWPNTEAAKRTVPELIPALKDEETAEHVAEALGRINDPRAIEPLIAVLNHRYPSVGRTAAKALDNIDPNWRKTKAARRTVPGFIAALKDEDWSNRSGATVALGAMKDPYAVGPLIDILKDQEWAVRCRAAEALGEIKDPRAVEPLIAALKDENWNTRRNAACALGKIQDPSALQPLITAALKDEEPDVRESAGNSMKEIKDPRAVEPLIAALKDENWNTRRNAACALSKVLEEIKDPCVVEPLITALKDENWHTRSLAALALGETKDPRAVEPLITALKDEVWGVRWGAAIAMQEIKDSRTLEPLIATLMDDHSDVRCSAAEALGKIKDPRAVEPLIAALKDKAPEVRMRAATALGHIKDQRSIKPLIAALEDRSRTYRKVEVLISVPGFEPLYVKSGTYRKVREALVEIGIPAVEHLIASLASLEEKTPSFFKWRISSTLREITGKDFGQDTAKWHEWWEQNKEEFLKGR